MAVMELKRALVTVQEMSMGNSAKVKAKSSQVVAGIESLLMELGAGNSPMPAGIVSLEEAPAPTAPAAAPAEEPAPVEESAVEEAAPAEEEAATAEEPMVEEEPVAAPEEAAEPAADEGDGGDDDEEDEDDE
jgi:hypothetical protein